MTQNPELSVVGRIEAMPELPESHGKVMICDFKAKPGDPIQYRDVYRADQMHAYALTYASQTLASRDGEIARLRETLKELLEAHTTPFPARSMFPDRDECIAGQNEWATRKEAAEVAARAALAPQPTKEQSK